MKKVLLALVLFIMLQGCTISRIDNDNYLDIMNNIISLNIRNYNKIGKGYKYYAPKGVIRVYEADYNDILKRGNNNYYLYVDVVSYYYKSPIEYEKSNNPYYDGNISNGNKNGHLRIENYGDSKLFVQMDYNYAKIETYIDNKDLNQTITDLSYILSSVKFNDSLLKKMYESGNFSSKDEVYKLFDNKEKEGNFLEYIKEYDKYDGQDDESIMREVPITTEKEQTTTTTKEE